MTDATLYLLDQLETADMLEIDGLHAWEFELDEALLDAADAAAEADQPFASEATVLRVVCLDGRDRREWRFSYNQVMEAVHKAADDVWAVQVDGQAHQLRCLGALSITAEDE
ncbi:MAG: hypothetical protein GAK45_01244 [Pseudomonas citronellolis]|nr:MAG: hypothetical protein GAK45_01244 [Pseudomonas citronellolis]